MTKSVGTIEAVLNSLLCHLAGSRSTGIALKQFMLRCRKKSLISPADCFFGEIREGLIREMTKKVLGLFKQFLTHCFVISQAAAARA
ncbi:MAG: hypothetical protein WKF89_05885, partial [Chitinophagaceae bacterium]